MLKILVVLTGGTIGSKSQSNVIDVSPGSAYRLIQLYQEKFGTEATFEIIQPYTILSENITPKYWGKLCQILLGVEFGQYDGVIIAHGTDTLSYTSAFLGMVVRHVPVPVVMVASNYPLDDPRSNGIANFRSAVCLISTKKLKGIYTVFQNNRGENIIYLATRIIESDTYQDQFMCYGGEAFGRMEKEKLILNIHLQNPTINEINQEKAQVLKKEIQFDNSILFIKPYPGLDYRFFQLKTKTKAVLHYLYHSATACVMGEEYSLLEFIKKCRDQGIDVYVASFKDTKQELYSTSKEILMAGAIPLMNISPEAAYVKLSIAYNQVEMKPEDFMKENIYYESVNRLGD